MQMTAQSLPLEGLQLLRPRVHEDARGHFFEAWNQSEVARLIGDHRFVQDNQSLSHRGVIRGLHYQLPHPQGKLVRVVTGAAFVVAVDIRRSSVSFGRWSSVDLSASDPSQLWVPPGFAHGFAAREEPTEVLYKVTAHFQPGCDRAIRWDDPEVGIEWPRAHAPNLSAKDAQAPFLAQAQVFD